MPGHNWRMSYGFRYFLFEADGVLRQVSQRAADGLFRGADRMPQYAGQSLRMAFVLLEVVDGQPTQVLKVEPTIWHFDESGSIRRELMTHLHRQLDLWSSQKTADGAVKGSTNVVDITRKIEERAFREKYEWVPTSSEITRLVHAIWPDAAGRPVKRPRLATGMRRKKPPMTYEAKHAIRECHDVAWKAARAIEDLKEPSLKAFAAEADEASETAELHAAEIWKGFAAAARRHLEVLRARRSRRGKWVAEATILVREDGERNIARLHTLEHEECDGRDAAVKAARRLLEKYAEKFDTSTRVEVEIMPAIEWRPEVE
jgi:hypothetical protein